MGKNEMMTQGNEHDLDLQAAAYEAVRRYGFQFDISSLAAKEVDAQEEDVSAGLSEADVRDVRNLLWSSIDNWESLDLDQLEYCERGQNGEILVKIAIADVDHFVSQGSKTDQYAGNNGNSVYTGVRTFSMLPERLSTDLSSLRAGVLRRAVVVEFVVQKDGNIRQGDIYRALVINKVKLVYDEVGSWLEGKAEPPACFADIPGLEDQVRLQDEAAERLRVFRVEQGALELETMEARVVKEGNMITALVLPQEDRAQHIIENFMIAANRTAMDFLERSGMRVIQRIVRVPKNWAGIRDVAGEFHEHLPVEPDVRALSLFLLKRKKLAPARFADLSLAVVKLLGPGEYEMLEPGKAQTGHFGLAISDYTHATAPNRRYVDLIIQRLLKAAMAGRPCPYTAGDLVKYAAWCTDRDKASKKVERFMRKVESSVLLMGRIGEVFDGMVTGASSKGTYVRLADPPVEGRVICGGERMAVGQNVRVRLIGLDPREGHIDLVRVRV